MKGEDGDRRPQLTSYVTQKREWSPLTHLLAIHKKINRSPQITTNGFRGMTSDDQRRKKELELKCTVISVDVRSVGVDLLHRLQITGKMTNYCAIKVKSSKFAQVFCCVDRF